MAFFPKNCTKKAAQYIRLACKQGYLELYPNNQVLPVPFKLTASPQRAARDSFTRYRYRA